MLELGKVEDEIFKNRQQRELQFKAREKAKKKRMAYNEHKPNWNLVKDTQFAPKVNYFKVFIISNLIILLYQAIGQEKSITNARKEAYDIRKSGMVTGNTSLKAMFHPAGGSMEGASRGEKRKASEVASDDSEDEEPNDEVRLWEDGFKDRYYESKFDVRADQIEFR